MCNTDVCVLIPVLIFTQVTILIKFMSMLIVLQYGWADMEVFIDMYL